MTGFNPHGNVTADGTLITEGLRVFTSRLIVRPDRPFATRLDLGMVIGDATIEMIACCKDPGHDKGQARDESSWRTDYDHVACEHGRCRHDHLFEVQTGDGACNFFTGERLATRFRPAPRRHVGLLAGSFVV